MWIVLCCIIVVVVVAAAAAANDDDDDDDVENNCDERGTTPQICTKDTGQCLCEVRYTGPRCDRCSTGFYHFPQCIGMSHSVPD